MKEQAKEGATTKPSTGTRSFSTSTRRRADMQTHSSSEPLLDPAMIPSAAAGHTFSVVNPSTQQSAQPPIQPPTEEPLPPGLRFPLPDRKKESIHRKDRYHTLVDQITNLIMKDGKKSVAQHNMSVILSTLRTSPAPTYSPTRALLPGTPPAEHLPLNPIAYLEVAIDSVAPLLRLRSQRGAAGGGVALQIPVPLGKRQRRRQAFEWILDAASKKQNRGSGRDTFPHRVAAELIAVVEGKSGVWERRGAVHKLATTARSNLKIGQRRR